MTENELNRKIAVINKKMEELRSERKQYEDALYCDKESKERAVYEKSIGKYLKTKGLNENKHSYVVAFKVLELEKDHNFRYARCLSIINGYRSTCWKEYGVSVLTLPLYCSNKLRMISKPDDPKMIDFYQEISEKEFKEIFRKCISEVKKYDD